MKLVKIDPEVKQTYSAKKTVIKGVKYFALFALPFIVAKFIDFLPQYANLTLIDVIRLLIPDDIETITVGAVLVMAANWFKNYVGVKFKD